MSEEMRDPSSKLEMMDEHKVTLDAAKAIK